MKQAMALDSPRQIEPATYQDVLDAPPNMVAEIIGGALRMQSRPAPPHLHTASRLGARLDRYFVDDDDGGPGGWRILDEPELHLAADILVQRPIYAREGVGHLWLVDPVARTLEAFELRNGEWVLIATLADDDDVKVRPFDAVTMKLSKFWP